MELCSKKFRECFKLTNDWNCKCSFHDKSLHNQCEWCLFFQDLTFDFPMSENSITLDEEEYRIKISNTSTCSEIIQDSKTVYMVDKEICKLVISSSVDVHTTIPFFYKCQNKLVCLERKYVNLENVSFKPIPVMKNIWTIYKNLFKYNFVHGSPDIHHFKIDLKGRLLIDISRNSSATVLIEEESVNLVPGVPLIFGNVKRPNIVRDFYSVLISLNNSIKSEDWNVFFNLFWEETPQCRHLGNNYKKILEFLDEFELFSVQKIDSILMMGE